MAFELYLNIFSCNIIKTTLLNPVQSLLNPITKIYGSIIFKHFNKKVQYFQFY
jgi:hypothetical protein